MLRVVPPDAGGAGEARGGGRKWPPAGTVAGDRAKMRVLQRFRGARPQNRCCLDYGLLPDSVRL